MKKHTRILALAISLLLLIGAVVGITVSAEDAVAPEIISYNVAHGNEFRFMFAVKADTVSGETLTLTVVDADGAEADEVTLAGEALAAAQETVNGVDCYVIATNKGVAAKDMADQYYITVEDGDAAAAAVRYSLAEYCFQRLYKDGIVNAAEGTKDYARKQLYLDTLAYGASAQSVLVNWADNDADADETPLSDYYYVYVEDGTVDGTYSAGIYTGETTVTLNYTGAEAIKGWKGVNADGTATMYANGDSVTVTEHTVFTTVESAPGFGKYAALADDFTDSTLWSGNGTIVNENGNDYLNIYASSGSTLFGITNPTTDEGNGNKYVLEYDFRMNKVGATNNIFTYSRVQVNTASGVSGILAESDRIVYGVDAEGNYYVRTQTGTIVNIEVGAWYTFRQEIVHYPAVGKGKVSVYLNDVYFEGRIFDYSSEYTLAGYSFPLRNVGINMDFDNVYIGSENSFDGTEGNFGNGVFASQANDFSNYTNNSTSAIVKGESNDYLTLYDNVNEVLYLGEKDAVNAISEVVVVEYDMRFNSCNLASGSALVHLQQLKNASGSLLTNSQDSRNYHHYYAETGTLRFGSFDFAPGIWANVRHEYSFTVNAENNEKYDVVVNTYINGELCKTMSRTITKAVFDGGVNCFTFGGISSSNGSHIDVDNFYIGTMTRTELDAAIAAKAAE